MACRAAPSEYRFPLKGHVLPTKSPQIRIPVKLHKKVALVRTADPVLAEDLLARKTLSRWIVGRLSDTVLLLQPGESELVIDELRRLGHTPRVAGQRD
jgi:hypothetical protein